MLLLICSHTLFMKLSRKEPVFETLLAYLSFRWWEGVVTEKSQKDETSFTVHFPAHGETSVVKAWLLRPCMMWKNGGCVERSCSQDNN
ncbi:hypothetical protein HRI_003235700 [Hibiscus trionum]|uniref:Uncharacterized protein n=1 Tax=Hibiscus trionum TaxID=183268 RepID=A0A9W7IGJ4_HIBTR|nr:hypothetical protein HRI_003235700 [Hibiscus trionum]